MPADWDEVGFVISSTYRTFVLEQLAHEPATPSQIAAADPLSVSPPHDQIYISHVSRALRRLQEHSLVELLVPDDRQRGRIYGITDHGTDVWQTIETEGLV